MEASLNMDCLLMSTLSITLYIGHERFLTKNVMVSWSEEDRFNGTFQDCQC